MKKIFTIIGLSTALVLSGCSGETSEKEQKDITELEQQIKELKVENSKLKTENAKLEKKVELLQKERVTSDKQ
ncbi:FtsB family cell division protein [Bacillus kexueae]|uniref:FtsB family cell division protein n=1 Tax=Aeribacillus kexueae TaxID=2078952 RepID=UPI001FAECD47|nr:lipoprotein [Bacillus kexueae]